MPDQVDWRAIEREATPGRAVGRLLHDQREARGLSIADVEKRIRIRRNYVEAIEQGRFDLLPGAAYIPAFLRMYASHLGLDPEKVLTAYQLSGPVPIKRPVALPADFPLVEKRAPLGLAVLTVLLAIGAGYAVWRYLPRHQTVIAEKVPPVPDRLLASRPVTPVISEPAPAPTPATTSAPAVTPVQVTAAPAPPPVTTVPAPTAAGPSSQETRPASGSTSPLQTWPASRQEAAAPPPAPPIVVAVPSPPPPVVMSAPAIGQAQAAQAPVDPQEARRAEPANPNVAPTPSPTGPATIPAKVDTPLMVRGNSWVELRAPNGDILAMTYVRAGESYTVPAGIAYRVIEAR
ncbi:MAG: helix-turn-helix domain-containing protein [Alphaproteobacteria bacterium]|nr:helix-turn-helix domain-containing protein [Alphaproteobacteria bacterium]